MSLNVHAYSRRPDGTMDFIDREGWEDLAGFESYRNKLYGSQVARSLGLRLLPQLADHDLYAEGEDVLRLEAEAELALANIEKFVAEAGASAEALRKRFENIISAARRAVDVGGGVVIW